MREGKGRDTGDFSRVQCTVTKWQCQEYSLDLLTLAHCSFRYIMLPEKSFFIILKFYHTILTSEKIMDIYFLFFRWEKSTSINHNKIVFTTTLAQMIALFLIHPTAIGFLDLRTFCHIDIFLNELQF